MYYVHGGQRGGWGKGGVLWMVGGEGFGTNAKRHEENFGHQ